MEQIKVLQLVSPKLGGIEAYVFEHYRHMDRTRYRFDFLTQNPNLEGVPQYRDLPYHVQLLRVTASQNQDAFIRQIREIFAADYDVLHLNSCFWTGFLLEELAREAGIRKVIVHSHSSFFDEPDEKKRAELRQRHEEVKRAFTPDLATDFWACSRVAADWLFGPQIPRDQIRIMKNAIEIEKFRFDPEKRNHVRNRLGLEDSLVLGTVGRLSYQKNQAFLIDVFAEFRRRHPNSKLLLVGDGELRRDLEKQAAERGLEKDILLLGWKTDVEDYLQVMDCFLLPSHFEGNPISLIEAAAAGLPAVIADTITREAVVASTIRQAPLVVSAWLLALEEAIADRVPREAGAKAVREAGYDIKRQAKVLEAMYRM